VLPIYLFGTINLQLHTSLNVSDANARLPFQKGQIGQKPINTEKKNIKKNYKRRSLEASQLATTQKLA